jgi:hypothetical protein
MALNAGGAEGRFHPTVYKVIAGLAAWFVISAWIFAGSGKTDYLLVIVSGLIVVMAGIVSLLALARRSQRRHLPAPQNEGPVGGPLHDWLRRDVETGTGSTRGLIAAIETILPIAAVAFGMTLFGLIVHFVAH